MWNELRVEPILKTIDRQQLKTWFGDLLRTEAELPPKRTRQAKTDRKRARTRYLFLFHHNNEWFFQNRFLSEWQTIRKISHAFFISQRSKSDILRTKMIEWISPIYRDRKKIFFVQSFSLEVVAVGNDREHFILISGTHLLDNFDNCREAIYRPRDYPAIASLICKILENSLITKCLKIYSFYQL